MSARNGPTESMRPIDRERFDANAARHLLNRAGFGGTRDQLRALLEWGPEQSVDHLLDLDRARERFNTPRFDDNLVGGFSRAEVQAYRRAQQTGDEDAIARFRTKRQSMQRADRQQVAKMQEWWLRHMVETPYPLLEKLTLFWHGHFATSYRTIENSWHMFQQNMFFREHAASSFEALLQGIIKDPAMLRYLDNHTNVKRSPNENLAREIMELFALGDGYTERDIKEGARALTGYTFEGNDFAYIDERHDHGAKRIFGQTGDFNGEQFVQLILSRKNCPRFIVEKLYTFFVADIPDIREPGGPQVQAVLRRMTSTMTRSKYKLKPVLRELFLSEHFFDAHNRGRLIKGPIELIVSTVRTLETPLRNERVLLQSAARMGQTLFAPPSVKGWEGGRTWINTSTLFERQNVANYLITGTFPGGRDPRGAAPTDPTSIMSDLRILGTDAVTDPARVAPYLSEAVLGEHATERHTRAIADYFAAENNRVTPETLNGALALLTAAPEYQLA